MKEGAREGGDLAHAPEHDLFVKGGGGGARPRRTNEDEAFPETNFALPVVVWTDRGRIVFV